MGSGGPEASVVLEVGRGRTEQRRRPVQSSRFLIGSSPRCDLCLGGGTIPPLHSLISTDGGAIWLEAIADAPELLVNGRAEKCVRLQDQDRLRIEPFELIVHLTGNAAAALETEKTSAPPLPEQQTESSDVSDLSALELVERIEAATELVNDFEQRSRLGMESLLAAANERRGRMVAGIPKAPRGSVLPMSGASAAADYLELADLESLVGHISDVVGELEKRTGLQWQREAGYRDAVSSLFESQRPPLAAVGSPVAAGRLAQHRSRHSRAGPRDRLNSASCKRTISEDQAAGGTGRNGHWSTLPSWNVTAVFCGISSHDSARLPIGSETIRRIGWGEAVRRVLFKR